MELLQRIAIILLLSSFSRRKQRRGVGKSLSKEIIFPISFLICFVSSGYQLFDLNAPGTKIEPLLESNDSKISAFVQPDSGSRKFIIQGDQFAGAQWYIPINEVVYTECQIDFNISSKNAKPYRGKNNVFLVLKKFQKNFHPENEGIRDSAPIDGEDSVVMVPIFRAAGTIDSAIGRIPLISDSGALLIEGFYIDLSKREPGIGEITISNLSISFEGNLLTQSEINNIIEEPPPQNSEIQFLKNGNLGIFLNGSHIESIGNRLSNNRQAKESHKKGKNPNFGFTRLMLNMGGDSLSFPELEPAWKYSNYINFKLIDNLFHQHFQAGDSPVLVDIVLQSAPEWWIKYQNSLAKNKNLEMDQNRSPINKRVRLSVEYSEIKKREIGHNSVVSDQNPEWISYCRNAVTQLLAHVRRQPYADRVLGYNVVMGIGMNDYPYPNRELHPNYRKSFQEWIKRKYVDEGSLRDAWDDKIITFNTMDPISKDKWATGDIFSFIHPTRKGSARDSYFYYFSSWADTLLQFAQLIKSLSQNRYITGVIGGPSLFLHTLWNNSYGFNSESLDRLIQSKNIDYFEVPVSGIDLRTGNGSSGSIDLLIDELKKNKKLLFTRNHLEFSQSALLKHGKINNPSNSILQIQRRIFSAALINNSYLYYTNLPSKNKSRINIAQEEIKQYTIIARKAARISSNKESEMAFVLDSQCLEHLAPNSDVPLLFPENNQLAGNLPPQISLHSKKASNYFYLFSLSKLSWHRLGIPFDIVFIDQLNPEKYKTLLFYHVYYLDGKRRKILQSCKSRNRTLISIWANGFVSKKFLSINGAEEFTNIPIRMVNKKARFNFSVRPELEELLNRRLPLNFLGPVYTPREPIRSKNIGFGPTFIIDDDKSKILCDHEGGIGPAMAMKENEGWKSLYSASPLIHPEILRKLMSQSGVHLYLNSNDISYINDSFISLHTLTEGTRELVLQESEQLYEVFRGQELKARKVHRIELKGKSTYLFFRGGKDTWEKL